MHLVELGHAWSSQLIVCYRYSILHKLTLHVTGMPSIVPDLQKQHHCSSANTTRAMNLLYGLTWWVPSLLLNPAPHDQTMEGQQEQQLTHVHPCDSAIGPSVDLRGWITRCPSLSSFALFCATLRAIVQLLKDRSSLGTQRQNCIVETTQFSFKIIVSCLVVKIDTLLKLCSCSSHHI